MFFTSPKTLGEFTSHLVKQLKKETETETIHNIEMDLVMLYFFYIWTAFLFKFGARPQLYSTVIII